MNLNKNLHHISDSIMHIFLQQQINLQTSRNFLLLLNHRVYHWVHKTSLLHSNLSNFNRIHIFTYHFSNFQLYTSIYLLIYFQQNAMLHSLFISGKLLYMFWVVSPLIIRSTHNCIYSIWYFLYRYCYLPLLWNWFERGVGIVLICFGAVADQQLHQYNSHTTLKPVLQ